MYERGWVIPPQATGGGVAEPAALQTRKWLSRLGQVERWMLEQAAGEISSRTARKHV